MLTEIDTQDIYQALYPKRLATFHTDIPPRRATAASDTHGGSQLVGSSQGEVPCSGTPRHAAIGGAGQGIELATFRLQVNPLSLTPVCFKDKGLTLMTSGLPLICTSSRRSQDISVPSLGKRQPSLPPGKPLGYSALDLSSPFNER